MYKRLILGSPGTGKTTRLLEIAEEKLQQTAPHKILFSSFTRKAVDEAKERACLKFSLHEKQLLNFRTLHSICYRELGMNNNKVIDFKDFEKIGKLLGFKFTRLNINEEELTEKGDKFKFLEEQARNMKLTLEAAYHNDSFDVRWEDLELYSRVYNKYKKEYGKLDFVDMLQQYLSKGDPLNIDFAIIDEAQDLNPLQWDVVDKVTRNCKEVYYAGDDDQAIYKWSGADAEHFMRLDVNDVEILPISYRLPNKIYDLASKITDKIKNRYPKHWNPQERQGEIKYHNKLEHILFEGNWLVLARSNYQLREIERVFIANDIFFSFKGISCIKPAHAELIEAYKLKQEGKKVKESLLLIINKYYEPHIDWYDALGDINYHTRRFYLSLLDKGIDLFEEPTIKLNTIHGSKGGECDNVLIITDIAKQVYENYLKNEEDEHRVFYVAATRAKNELHILTPQTEMFYEISTN